MENETLQRRSTATTDHMGNQIFLHQSLLLTLIYSGINSRSTFGAQGDSTNDKLTILPVLPDTHSITQAQHTLYDEQLSTR